MGNTQSHAHSHGDDGCDDDHGHSHSHSHGDHGHSHSHGDHGHSHSHGGHGHSHSHGGHSHGAHAHPNTTHMILHVAGGHALLGARFPEGAAPQLELIIMDDLPIVQTNFPMRITNNRGETVAITLRQAAPNSLGGTRFAADVANMTKEDELVIIVSIIIDGQEADVSFEGFEPGHFVVP